MDSVLCTLLTILVKLEWLRVNFHLLGLPFNISPRPEAKDGFPLIDQRTHSSRFLSIPKLTTRARLGDQLFILPSNHLLYSTLYLNQFILYNGVMDLEFIGKV